VLFLSALVLAWASMGRPLGRVHGSVLIGSYALYAGIRLATS